MIKIAILDTKVEKNRLKNRKFRYYSVLNGRDSGVESALCSHGTVCAMILDYLTKDYELINIQIMEEPPSNQGKPMGYIEDLRKGLELCLDLKPDLICMSAVTSVLSDSKELYSLVKKISEKSTVIAALDNKGYVTVPSSYPFVIGVLADRENILGPGEVMYREDGWLCSNVFANCQFDWLKEHRCTPSNSLAVPVVAAKLNDWINQGKEILKMLKQTEKPNLKLGTLQLPVIDREQVPVAVIYSQDVTKAYRACIRTMDCLYADYGVQAVCLSGTEETYDIRVKKLRSVEKDLPVMQRYYRADLIFLALDMEHYMDVKDFDDIDLFIYLNETDELFRASYENKSITEKREKMTEKIYQILTE